MQSPPAKARKLEVMDGPNLSAASDSGDSGPSGSGAEAENIRSARRPPASLFDRTAQVLADRILERVATDRALLAAARSLLSELPPRLADALTATLVSRYVDLHGEDGGGDDDDDALALLDVLDGAVSTVDMSPLVWLGQSGPTAQIAFSAKLVDTLPRLHQVTRLCLGTHGQRFTLPVCTDDVLHAVAQHCPALRHLDVSHNTAVSAFGLTSLCAGCPLLEELLVHDCVLPAGVLAGVLQALPQLRVLGHQEVGTAVLLLFRQRWGTVQQDGEDGVEDHHEGAQGERRTLRLTQVTNLGETAIHRSKGEGEATRLRCRPALVRALRVLCPELEELRVRALDGDVRHLASLRSLQALELRFHAAAKPSSLGPHTLQYVRLHGARLTELTVYSHSLSAHHFDALAAHCPQLRHLWMRANFLNLEAPAEEAAAPPAGPRFPRLENLSLRVGWDERSVCRLPAAFVQGLVRDARALRKLYVAANSADLTDEWLRQVLDAVHCAALRTLFVLLPARNAAAAFGYAAAAPRLALTPDSVRLVRARCPDLEELGNLLVWSLQQEEVRHLQQQLRAANCTLKLVAKETVWR